MPYLPVCLNLAGRPCLIVGGGAIARQKVEALLPTGARLTVVAPRIDPEIASMVGLCLLRRDFDPTDLEGHAVVIAATDNPELNHRVHELATARGILVNVVDDPPYCQFIFPSILRRGEFTLAVSSGGASPALARLARESLEPRFGPRFGELVERLATLRRGLRLAQPDLARRRRALEAMAALSLARAGEPPETVLPALDALAVEEPDAVADEESIALLEPLPEEEPLPEGTAGRGEIVLVGAGPGDPDLLTIGGLKALQAADIVFYDRLVNPELLAHAIGAELVYVGKEPGEPCGGALGAAGALGTSQGAGFGVAAGRSAGAAGREPHGAGQARINAMLIEAARRGLRVVRLKGGDPFVFGRGAEEVLAARAAGIAVRVVPGVTAGVAVPAAASIPLTHRGVSASVAFVTGCAAAEPEPGAAGGAVSGAEGSGAGQDESGENAEPAVAAREHARVQWRTLATSVDTLVIYMGLARLREVAAELIAAGRAPDDPVAVIGRGTLPEQQVRRALLGELAAEPLADPPPSPVLVVVGAVVDLAPLLALAPPSYGE